MSMKGLKTCEPIIPSEVCNSQCTGHSQTPKPRGLGTCVTSVQVTNGDTGSRPRRGWVTMRWMFRVADHTHNRLSTYPCNGELKHTALTNHAPSGTANNPHAKAPPKTVLESTTATHAQAKLHFIVALACAQAFGRSLFWMYLTSAPGCPLKASRLSAGLLLRPLRPALLVGLELAAWFSNAASVRLGISSISNLSRTIA